MSDDRDVQSSARAAASERVEALLERMTLREKLGQMTQKPFHGPSEELSQAVGNGEVGSVLNAKPLEERNALQKLAVEGSRLGVPLVFGRDVIHGLRTVMPIPLGQSATFDPEAVERGAHVAATEAREAGIDWTFAPMVDVTRDPRWGRVAESPGEDPYLAARMGEAMVRGFQGGDPALPDRVAACAKHFVGYGASESGKDYNTTWIPEQLLRELHLPAFKACVDADVLSLMSAFNDLNGVPATGNVLTLRRILKGEWGFGGMVVSDWGSIWEMIAHGYCEDGNAVAKAALRAGVDMEMATQAYLDHLEELTKSDGELGLLIDDAVRRVLTFKHRLGLFDHPYAEAPRATVALSAPHREVAQRLARESLVLLKNDGGLLPVATTVKKLAVVGPLADDGHSQLGCWAHDGRAEDSVTPLAALRAGSEGRFEVWSAPGLPHCRSEDRSGFDEAVAAARGADLVVAFVGEDANISGECRSRAFLSLPGAQEALLAALASTGTPLAVVIMAGRPLVLEPMLEHTKALLYAWHPGTLGGPAIAEVLLGEPPCGKLPISFPRSEGQIPVYYAHKSTGRPPKSDRRSIPSGTALDPVDFDSGYIDLEVTPLFPFGYGLSYTTFRFDTLEVSPARVQLGQTTTVSAQAKNTGKVRGTEVVQLYVRDRVGSITRPVRELKAFRRVTLDPGESCRVSFELDPNALSFIGQEMKPVLEPGEIEVFVGGDSRATLSASFWFE